MAPSSRAVPVVALVVFATLLATASRYGYHRDELYFLAAGRHLSWGYDDQGPVVPLLARAAGAIAPGSLTLLRVPSAVAIAVTVWLCGSITRELGGTLRAQAIAALTWAVSVIALFTGHTLGTSSLDLLVWTAATWAVVRAERRGRPRWWAVAGLTVGLGVLNKPLPAFLGVALLVSLAACGPRRALRTPWPWVGALLAAAGAAPVVVWQAQHGWPQLDVSRAIASGRSTSSQPWWLVVPFQALLAGPVLAPVWITGLVRLARDTTLRYLVVTWALLAVAFMITGGKPYYLAGMLPVLIAAGGVGVDRWLDRSRARRGWFAAAVALSAVAGVVIALPVLPTRDAGPVIAMNADVGETIGWPQVAAQVAGVYRSLPGRPVVLAENYGEAGALQRFGPRHGLPADAVYSGQNAYWRWGRPAGSAGPVVVVGYVLADAARHFSGCRLVRRLRTGADNEEDGEPVLVCAGPRGGWAVQWPRLRRLG